MHRKLLVSLLVSTACNGTFHALAAEEKTTRDTVAGQQHMKIPRQVTSAQSEAISVIGAGSTRQLQRVSEKQFQMSVPGTNPLKVLGQLPGVAYNSSDPLGTDPWSQSFYMRGFSQDQLGFTLDGISLGSQSYYSYNGLSINEAISPENIQGASVSQGAGGLDVATSSNLGGTVQFSSRDPSDKMGGKIAQTFGSYDAFRTFVRLDSGVLNKSGTKFYVSYGRTSEDKWKGAGSSFMQQVNAKLVQPFGNSTTLTAFFDWDQNQSATYADMSLEMIHKLGTGVDYYYPNYGAAYDAARGKYPPGFSGLSDPKDAAYYDGPSMSENFLGGLHLESRLSEKLKMTTNFYAHDKTFLAWWTNPYESSPSGAPLAEQVGRNFVRRYGFTEDLTYHLAHHLINAGVWYENNSYQTDRLFYNEPILGEGQPFNPYNYSANAFARPWGLAYNTNTFQFHLQDTYRVLPNLSLHAGFKSMIIGARSHVTANDIAYTGVDDSQRPSGSMTASDAFLPQFSANWRFFPHNELFFDISKNLQAFPEAGYNQFSPWGVATKSEFKQIQKNLKPEKDWVYEVGYRYSSTPLTALLSLYRTDFSNRLQSVTTGSLVNVQSTLQNVGSVQLNGVDATLILRPIKGLSLTNNISYNHSEFENNIVSGGTTYHLKGKLVPNFPELMYKGALAYEWRGINAHIDTIYMGNRYLSYVNDTAVGHYWLENFGVSYTFSKLHFAKALNVAFNIYNLTNIKYVSTMGESGNPLSGDYQSLQIGAPRTFYGTVSADF
ncbi:iron complex outermembrane receptor protein [Gluconacetobacter liquefaciens]|nr:iron complex outermembrane receptor protein [Gluconacetobacter liquefaciens]